MTDAKEKSIEQVDAPKKSRKLLEAERDLINATLDYQRIGEEIETLRENQKNAKEYMEACGIRVRHLRTEEGITDGDDFQSVFTRTQCVPDVPGVTGVRPADAPENLGEVVERGEDWRDQPITVLRLDTIPGFGPKKRKNLIKEVPTLGGLENIRAKAAVNMQRLHKVMPKGVGEDISEAIENMYLAWLNANGFGGCEAEAVEAVESPAAETEKKAAGPAGKTEQPEQSEQLEQGEPDMAAFVATIREAGDFDSRFNKEIWQDGRRAFGDGWEVTDLTWVAGSDQAAEWIRGWLFAEAVYNREQVEQVKQDESQEPETDLFGGNDGDSDTGDDNSTDGGEFSESGDSENEPRAFGVFG